MADWFSLGAAAIGAAGKVGAAGAAGQPAAPNTSGGLFDSSGWSVSTGGALPGGLSGYLPWALAAVALALLFKGRK